ncbi:MAG: hypothetical protein ACOCVB_00590 [Bacillota bacterium]
MDSRKVILGFLIIIMSFFLLSGCSSKPSNIGIMDMDRVIEESERAAELQQRLSEVGSELEERIEEEDEDLSEEEQKNREEEIYQEYNNEKSRLEEKLNKEMEEVLAEITEEENIEIVLYKNSVHYGGIDITSEVIEKMDEDKSEEEENNE